MKFAFNDCSLLSNQNTIFFLKRIEWYMGVQISLKRKEKVTLKQNYCLVLFENFLICKILFF